MDFMKTAMDMFNKVEGDSNSQPQQSAPSTGYGYTHGPQVSEYRNDDPPGAAYNHGPPQSQTSSRGENSSYYNPGPTNAGPPPPPRVPYPWVAHWDAQESRYTFVNETTGERSWQPPTDPSAAGYEHTSRQGYPPQQPQGGNFPPPQQQQQYEGYEQPAKPKKDHGMLYGALGGAAAAGAVAWGVHEYDEHRDEEQEEKRRVEEGVDDGFGRGEEDVARFDDDANRGADDVAGWVGRRVGEVEAVPDDVEQGFERFGERVEDAPEDLSRWAGEKVGDVERFGDNVEQFGDNMDDAYDAGRDEGRYGDDDY